MLVSLGYIMSCIFGTSCLEKNVRTCKEESKAVNPIKKGPLTGTVTTRACPFCGHHEVGLITEDGSFFPLKPGTPIQILDTTHVETPELESLGPIYEKGPDDMDDLSGKRLWIPDPLKGNRSLCLLFGVMIPDDPDLYQINGEIYQASYLKKIQRLIEREVQTPLAVILDQYFTAPHLASGNPRQIAQAMWQALEEIKKPALLMNAWLENPTESRLENLRDLASKGNSNDQTADETEIMEAFDNLTLVEFLDLFLS